MPMPTDAVSGVIIVTLDPERWHDYRAVRLEALRHEPAAFSTSAADAAMTPEREWRRRLSDPAMAYRFAEYQGRLVALAGVRRADIGERDIAVVVSVYVAAEWRGRGIGRRLVETVLEAARQWDGVTRARLWVAPSQTTARTLYRELGFVFAGESPEGELILERPLG